MRFPFLAFALGFLLAGCMHPRPPTSEVAIVQFAPLGAFYVGRVTGRCAPSDEELRAKAEKLGADFAIVKPEPVLGADHCSAELYATH
jgi:hypothetical protein